MRISDWSSDVCSSDLLGRAFFGESMVSRETDASKVALAWLVARLKYGGFTLLDCQFQTDHLASLGTIEIPRDDYLARLASAAPRFRAICARSEEHTSELQSLMRISYAVFCLKKKK